LNLIVQKFGGSSVANAERLINVANRVTEAYKEGNSVVVVVSAQGDTTDEFLEKAAEINSNPSKREMDVLLSAGEQISMSLLAMAIEKLGFPVVSLTGWQAGMNTNSLYGSARIKTIETERIKRELDAKRIVIVAGFQGINKYDDITISLFVQFDVWAPLPEGANASRERLLQILRDASGRDTIFGLSAPKVE